MMADWLVALLLLFLSLILIVSVLAICRMMGVWRITNLFSKGDETAKLTKTEHQAYDVSTKQTVQTQGSDNYHSMEEGPPYPIPQDLPEPIPDPYIDSNKPDSPSPTDNTSMGSDADSSVLQRGRLKRAMSCDSVASDSSVYDWQPEDDRIGQLEFGLEYDGDAGELIVSVIQARGLEPDQVTGTLDTYVKLWLIPSADSKLQTKVQKSSVDPVYKERFILPLANDKLDDTITQFQVYSSDKYARHKLQGETEIRLGDLDLRCPVKVWMNLKDIDDKPTELGDILFSLSYLPTAERLTVVVVKARHLNWGKGRDQGDCIVKVYLMNNERTVSKKKTSVKRDIREPIFNEAMIFSVPSSSLQSIQLRISLAETSADGKLSSIGHVTIGSQMSGTELTHWNQMMTSLRKPTAMWHRLRK